MYAWQLAAPRPVAENTSAMCSSEPSARCRFSAVLRYSAYRAVFSFSALRQLSQPSGLTWPPISQSTKVTLAYGRHGRPR